MAIRAPDGANNVNSEDSENSVNSINSVNSVNTHNFGSFSAQFYILSHPALRVYSLASLLLMVVPSDVEVFTLSQISFGKVLTCSQISWKTLQKRLFYFSFCVIIFGLFNKFLLHLCMQNV